ncbi:MAG: ATP-binding protein [Pseudomonadota bacterium]
MQRNNEELTQAFAAFNAHSQGLHVAYQQLQDKVSVLAKALNEAKAARIEQKAIQQHITARYAELLEALPAAVVVTDSNGVVVDANAIASELFEPYLIGNDWKHYESTWFSTCAMDGADLRTDDDRIFNAARSSLADGGEMIVFTDVSQARSLSDAAHRQHRLATLGEMVARMAHQIRTPLAAAMLYACDVETDTTARDKLLVRLKALATLVDDMLCYASGAPSDQSVLNSGMLLCQVADEARDTLPDGIALQVRGTGTSYEFSGNQHAIVGALHNLIANAVAHTQSPGSIVLSDRSDASGHLVLEVEDTGVGVPAHLRDQVFEPFFTTRAEGTGLGLAIVRSIARAHGGDADCRSGDIGSVFSLRFPFTGRIDETISPVDDVPQFAISASASSAFFEAGSVVHG